MKVESKVPKIRFRTFSHNYSEYRLSDFLERYSERNTDEEFGIEDILSLSSEYGVVDRKKLLGDTYEKVNHKNYMKTRLRDFIYGKSITKANPFGLFRVNSIRDGLLSTLYFTFKVSNNVSPYYLDHYFSHPNRANNLLRKYVLVGDRYITADSDYILSGKVYLPNIEEQEKVSTFLSIVNKKIEFLQKKKDKLEEYKKGMVQKIFSQEIRFKDESGNNFPDWEMKNGDTIFASNSNKKHDSNLPILAVTQDNGAIPRDEIEYSMSVKAKSIASYKVVDVGDFIISLRSFQGGIEYSEYHGICSPAYIILKPKLEICSYFYKYYLKTHFYIQQLNSKLEGIRDGKMVSYKYFSEIKLPYPVIEEQQKIATFLSSIDKKIQLVDNQLTQTQLFKKALLQQMFV